jgi:hypothetical protein
MQIKTVEIETPRVEIEAVKGNLKERTLEEG